MKNLFITVLCTILCANLTAQLSSFNIEELINSGYYTEALEAIYAKRKELNSSDYSNLAVLAYNLHDYKKSNELFNQVGSDFTLSAKQKEILFEVQRINELYEESRSNIPTSFSVSNFIDFPLKNTEVNKNILIEKSKIEFGRTFMGLAISENSMLLARSLNNKSEVRDLWRYNFDGSDNLGDEKRIKTKSENFIYRANPTFVNDKEYIYTKSIVAYTTFKKKKESNKVTNNLLKLFKYNKETEKEEELTVLNSDKTNTVTPFYWKEQEILFYAVSSVENENFDIYYCKGKNGNWAKPEKLGEINTGFNEVYPFVKEGMLYFSSRGHENYGGLDLFSVPISVEGQTVVVNGEPKNLGKPFNSSFDDFALSYVSDKTGFFASNREGEGGADELFSFIDNTPKDVTISLIDNSNFVINDAVVNVYKKDKKGNKTLVNTYKPDERGKVVIPTLNTKDYELEVNSDGYIQKLIPFSSFTMEDIENRVLLDEVIVYGNVIDGISGLPLKGMNVSIYELKDGKYQLVETVISDENGKWEYPFNRNKEYKVEFEKIDYTPLTFTLPTSKDKKRRTVLANIVSTKVEPALKKGDVVRLQNITFDFGSAKLTEESYKILDKVVAYLNNNPTTRIELSAHTDCESSYGFNMRLSKARAKSSFDYLVSKGIDPSRIKTRGYGEKYILNGCKVPGQCSKEKNRENRRVELKFL